MESNKKEYYIRIHQEKTVVTEEIRAAWNQMKDRVFYTAHLEGSCGNTDYKTCTGDCMLCRHKKEGKIISLDDETKCFRYSAKGKEHAYCPVENVPDPADIVCGKDMAERMLMRAKEVCPCGDEIFLMYSQNYSSYEIAEELNIPQTTVYRRVQKIKRDLALYYRTYGG